MQTVPMTDPSREQIGVLQTALKPVLQNVSPGHGASIQRGIGTPISSAITCVFSLIDRPRGELLGKATDIPSIGLV